MNRDISWDNAGHDYVGTSYWHAKCASCGHQFMGQKRENLCQQCNDEIDRRADEVMGNVEDDDG